MSQQGKKIEKSFWYNDFLTAYKECAGIVTHACKVTGVTPQSYYNYRVQDKKFNELMQHTTDSYCVPVCEDIVFSLARKGNERMLMLILKNRAGTRWNQGSAAYELIQHRLNQEKAYKEAEEEQRVPTKLEMQAAKAYRKVLYGK